eukprot:CAMPEP_0113899060 /NCGR_PEP_ID=MMETSP0780_2-20120614/19775_1 /TAXON_ID=652834 /ORGANISM="Palpitomonas bilix" /LENGTH=219 /DNA_ID=CAMNT_0000891093 /DNA_START=489 /DNA_END=1148 /DNA_ORIENTATION=+ /assembly_acc=CAM_ASM_000599
MGCGSSTANEGPKKRYSAEIKHESSQVKGEDVEPEVQISKKEVAANSEKKVEATTNGTNGVTEAPKEEKKEEEANAKEEAKQEEVKKEEEAAPPAKKVEEAPPSALGEMKFVVDAPDAEPVDENERDPNLHKTVDEVRQDNKFGAYEKLMQDPSHTASFRGISNIDYEKEEAAEEEKKEEEAAAPAEEEKKEEEAAAPAEEEKKEEEAAAPAEEEKKEE